MKNSTFLKCRISGTCYCDKDVFASVLCYPMFWHIFMYDLRILF